MDSRLFESKLINHKIFKDLKDSLKENPSGKLRNLIDLRDDVLYVWNPKENCLFCLNLRRLEEHDEETMYQKLHFSTPPAFPVERVVTSTCGSRVCVYGSRGVSVAELPARWGRGGLFQATSTTLLCKSYSLDERFLYSQGEVRKVQWHPNSLSHLLVLVSDNTMRLYNIALKSGPKLAKVFTIGPKPHSQLAGRTFLDCLGDTAVDFTATPDGEALLILRGNGDVHMMTCNLDGKSVEAKITGPLAMYPPADDNYGTDSCSILAIGGGDLPPLVIVAACTATLYHCLLLPNSSEKEYGDGHALYVVETVELNIDNINPSEDLQHTYPMHLYTCGRQSYACAHGAGLHVVALPALAHIQHYAQADEAESTGALSALCSARASARQVLRTTSHPPGLAPLPPAPPRPMPTLLLLCDTPAVFIRTVEPHDIDEQFYKEIQLRNPSIEQEDIDSILKERQKLSFTSIVQQILRREVSQPILHVSGAEPSAKDCLEFALSATVALRSEYISRQQRAVDALCRKVSALRALSSQHHTWIADLQKDLDEVMQQSADIKEKCALADQKQDDIKYRCSSVIRRLRAGSVSSPAERALLAELQKHSASTELRQQQIHALKQHARDKSEELKKWQEEYKKKDVALGKSHSDTISSILQQQTSLISTLIEETKLLKDQLSIV